MAATRTPIQAEMDDGRVLTAMFDQRDMAVMEALELPDRALMLKLRALAWSALRRSGQYTGTWEQFNEKDCVEAVDPSADEDEPEGEQGLDPGLSTSSEVAG
jgi:hypothetical protein